MQDLALSTLMPLWPIVYAVITLVGTIWVTGKLHNSRIAHLEKSLEILDKRYETTEKEMVLRLRGIEIQITQLVTTLSFLIKEETGDK